MNCQFKMEDGTPDNCPREGRNEVKLVELEPDLETGINRETDKVTKFYLCDEHLEEMHYRYHSLYFAKKYEDETLFDSTRGFDSLSEAMEVAIAGGYQVIEERLHARPDHPLSGTFVKSHAVIVSSNVGLADVMGKKFAASRLHESSRHVALCAARGAG